MTVNTIITPQPKINTERLYTIEEYWELEEMSAQKHEYNNGKIIPMAGGTFNHMALSNMLCALLTMRFLLMRINHEVINSDYNIYIPEYKKMVYSDGGVIIGEPEFYGKTDRSVTNPAIIIEVLSKSTAAYDRGAKFEMYKTLPSFKEYVLVNQYAPIIEVFLKTTTNDWKRTIYTGLDKVLTLETINVELKLADIYKKTRNLKDPQLVMDFK